MRTGRGIDAGLRQAEPLHRPAVHNMLLDDFGDIFRLHKPVPDRLRIDHDCGPVLALVQAAGLVGAYRRLQAGGGDRLLEQPLQLALAVRGAAATSAARSR